MGALGDYVHLYWKNYKKYGIGTDKKNKTQILDIQDAHKDLLEHIKSFSQAEETSLKSLEDQYNKDTADAIAKMDELEGESRLAMWAAIIKTAKQENFFDINDPDVLAYIDSVVEIDKEHKQLQKKEGAIFKTDITFSFTMRARRKPTPLKQIMRYFGEAVKAYKKVKENKEGKIPEGLKKIICTRVEPMIKNIKKLLDKTSEYHKIDWRQILKTNGNVPAEFANNIIKYINEIRHAIEGSNFIGKLQPYFQEIVGHSVREEAYQKIETEDLVDMFEEVKKKGATGTQSTNTNRDSSLSIDITQPEYDQIIKELKEEGKIEQKKYERIFSNAGGDTVKMKVDYSVPNKADFVMILSGTKDKEVGVSMKNIFFNPDEQGNIKGDIHFQANSSLIFFLIGMEQFTKTTRGLGTHILNFFAEDNGQRKRKNNKLIRFLTTWILYSAMSGRLQGMSSNAKMADVLIIQPKNSSRAKLFDISTLVEKIVENNDIEQLKIYKILESLSFSNRRIEGATDTSSRLRIAKILIQARLTRVDPVVPKRIVAQYQQKS